MIKRRIIKANLTVNVQFMSDGLTVWKTKSTELAEKRQKLKEEFSRMEMVLRPFPIATKKGPSSVS